MATLRSTPQRTAPDVRGLLEGTTAAWSAIVVVVIILTALAAALGLGERAAELATKLLPERLASFGSFVWTALIASTGTQLMSNTVVQLALFETLSIHPGVGASPVYLLLVVTLCSTCAFMTPVATGVNGLVYGEMRGILLSRMLVAGAATSVVSAVVIAGWVYYVVAP